ncbi:VRR-NUC domain-containing protein [Candidatus Nanohalobium constans]|uniref:VRR-NUC domain protein n=1 Tax=Candidatus Nanohalobium constans TaxID=2565781 RepID=A0A5Q0UG73_9ARCH|nr:VRR-NUC domain-containing protein [Candidatus Nanohalobium constans]QGA80618.1 VRR-NUC domain protein [Candidatus Nanohalobium constans]
MIPFEKQASLTPSEEYAQELLEANWEQVVRTTPGMLEDLQERFPKVCETLSREIRADAQKDISNIFKPGVPDFLAFNQKGEYKFVEIKTDGDGLRHTQLKWLKDFREVNAEIWFTRKKEVEDKLDTENIGAYTFQDRKGENSEDEITEEVGSKYLVELPKTLASILGLSKEDSVEWRLKNKNELILDSK